MSEQAHKLLSRSYAPAVEARIATLPSRDQRPIVRWLLLHPIGTNYALQVLEFLKDLAQRDNVAPAVLLTQSLSRLGEDERHPKELGKKLRDLLQRQLHPVSQAHQDRFLNHVESLGLPSGVRLKAPRNFEGRAFTLEIEFSHPEELRQHLEAILAHCEQEAWKQLKDF